MAFFAKVENVMAKKVVSFGPEDNLGLVVENFEKYNFDGFPVLDKGGHLVGLVTAYDMIVQSSKVHLPVVAGLLEQIARKETDQKVLQLHFEKLKEIKVEEIMNVDPLVVNPDARVEDLAREFVEHHRVNPIPVVDDERKLVGIVSRYDVIRFFNEHYMDEVLKNSGHGGVLKRLTRIEEQKYDH